MPYHQVNHLTLILSKRHKNPEPAESLTNLLLRSWSLVNLDILVNPMQPETDDDYGEDGVE